MGVHPPGCNAGNYSWAVQHGNAHCHDPACLAVPSGSASTGHCESNNSDKSENLQANLSATSQAQNRSQPTPNISANAGVGTATTTQQEGFPSMTAQQQLGALCQQLMYMVMTMGQPQGGGPLQTNPCQSFFSTPTA